MVTIKTDIRLWPSLLIIRPVYPIKFLLLQIVIIEASLYGCDKLAILAQIHTSLSYIYVIWVLFSNSILNKKQPNDNKYSLGLCVFVPRFTNNYLSQ